MSLPAHEPEVAGDPRPGPSGPEAAAPRQPAQGGEDLPRRTGEAASNGWGLPDHLLEPLVDMAIECLPTLRRNQVPPRLAPLAGSRPRRIRPEQRRAIREALGRHERLTEAVLEAFAAANSEELERLGEVHSEELVRLVDEEVEDPSEMVAVLLSAGRTGSAHEVAARFLGRQPVEDGLPEIAERLARARLEADEQERRLRRELESERRARRSAERRLAGAGEQARAAQARAARAEDRARRAEARFAEVEAEAQKLRERVDALLSQEETGRRERRDLRGELEDLQARFQRMRRELRETRARLPAEEGPAPPAPEAPSPRRRGASSVRSSAKRGPGGSSTPSGSS